MKQMKRGQSASHLRALKLPQHILRQVRQFFEEYKSLENKEVIVEDMLGPKEAIQIIRAALDLYRRLRRGELGRKG